jgi:dTDP-glucose 4,6-dehydratase
MNVVNGNILITGGAGFIGATFVRKLSQDKTNNITILDKLTYAANTQSISKELAQSNVSFFEGDINDSDLVSRILREYQIDIIVNFAAESHVDRSISGPSEFVHTNVNGTFNILECARQVWNEGYDNKLLLHVSTDEVYGSLSATDKPFNEYTPYKPSSPYSSSKAASDHLVSAWNKTYGLPVIITNCSNNYGPWQFPEKLIPLTILNAIERKPIPIYGDGKQIRDWLHVNDHCDAILNAILHGAKGDTYCIGGNNELANIDVVKTICDKVDVLLKRKPQESRQLIHHVDDRLGHDSRYAIDSSKIQNELGWQPSHTFNESITELIKWYTDNLKWVNEMRSDEYRTFYETQYKARLAGR